MPTYTANIQLQDALDTDYALLNKELKQRSFRVYTNSRKGKTTSDNLSFKRKGSLFHEVASDLVTAAKKTGKPFSFTIQKDKEN